MTEFKIEKNIPFRKDKREFPFYKMEVGDSVLITPKKEGKRVECAFRSFVVHKGDGWRMAARAEGDGIRLWRIS